MKNYDEINERINFVQKVVLWSFGVMSAIGIIMIGIYIFVNLF